MGGRPVAIYLLVNVLNIYANDANDVDDVDDVDNVDDVDDVGDVGDADLAKTLLPTVTFLCDALVRCQDLLRMLISKPAKSCEQAVLSTRQFQ
jgi:hypothetical protein